MSVICPQKLQEKKKDACVSGKRQHKWLQMVKQMG